MADFLYFSRNVKLYIELDAGEFWEIPVLDGFSYTQSTNSSEITLNEATDTSGNSRRERLVFNDSLAPAEWSFSTYLRPFNTAGGGIPGNGIADDTANIVHAVEEVLWACMFGSSSQAYTPPNAAVPAAFTDAVTFGAQNPGPGTVINLNSSNKSVLKTFSIYFHLGDNSGGTNDIWHKVNSACVNEATIDFDIDGIATIQWSGYGSSISDVAAPTLTNVINEDINATDNYIRNRLSTITMDGTAMAGGGYDNAYDIILTGGSININNNISYLTPETLGSVNQPLGHVTGSRTIGGNFTCYLGLDDVADPPGDPTDLWADIYADLTRIQGAWDVAISVGGPAGSGNPTVVFDAPKVHFELPAIGVEDILTLDVNFHVLPSDIGAADEITLTYDAA